MDSSYNVQINMSVRRGIIWGIDVYDKHKGEVRSFTNVYM